MSDGAQDPFRPPGRAREPEEDAVQAGAAAGQVPGDLPARLIARLIDTALLSLIGYPLNAALDLGHMFPLIQAVAIYAYFVPLDAYVGTTLGKRLLGLRVTGPKGGRPRVAQAAIRESFMLAGLVAFIPFVVGIVPFGTATTIGQVLTLIVWIAIGVTINKSPAKQGKHDALAGGTRVIKA